VEEFFSVSAFNGYEKLMDNELQKYVDEQKISLKEDIFLKGMETIYHFSGEFMEKTVEFDGFTFQGEAINKQQMFILRFGIIHCIANSGVFGMVVEFPKDIKLQDDQ
jgi:putative membrane protein